MSVEVFPRPTKPGIMAALRRNQSADGRSRTVDEVTVMSVPPNAVPPNAQMSFLLTSAWTTQAISDVTRLGVPETLADGPLPLPEIAARVGAHPPTLNRVLRALTELGLFTSQDGGYALTPLGATLVPGTPGSLASMAVMLGSSWQSAAREGLYESILTGSPASLRLWEGGFFGYMGRHPEDAAVFNQAMIEISASSTAAVAAGYDFGRFTTLVDVGGGSGYLIGAILADRPALRGVLFDLPDVVAGVGDILDRLGVADRCDRVGGNFFDSVPDGADGYLISNVLHDWDDDQALVILRNCAKAMGSGSTLLIAEWVLPDGSEPAPVSNVFDLEMLMVTDGGRQRSASEFAELLGQVGLRLVSRTQISPQIPTLLEVVPAE